ncbi:unnamed protein product [Mycena citricolor]|uniref:MFS general substrate transporter n=1 Tax=Mycena citricolor TaxID=2018698 RepID=A0AAD2GYU4_9AGAR|nr:unnamed protein product [Mycena citricolor]CAK5265040.1 unnamed protein product [Mycena citricolor]
MYSHSRSRSRTVSPSRHQATQSVSYVASGLPDGLVDDETVELLQELVHPHGHDQDATLVDDSGSVDALPVDPRPWWKRPSPWWLMAFTPFSVIAMSATLVPKVEIYTLLACSVHKPEIFAPSASLPQYTLAGFVDAASARPGHPPAFDIALATTEAGAADRARETPIAACAADPVVQAAVAKLNTAITTTMGALGCLTTGWWGSYSDRRGRTRVLGLTVFGLLMNDFVFLAVTKHFQTIPGGYWFLMVGPVLEGLLGGFTTGSAASHAYIADITPPSERSRVFSTFLGLVFTGLSAGPTAGGLLIKYTHNTLSVFYLTAAIHALYAFMTWFLLPESLSAAQMQASALQKKEREAALARRERTLLFRVERMFAFLQPLAVFFPERVPGKRGRDWNLMLLAAGYGLAISIMGSMSFKTQYLIATFHWTSENIGYLLTITGASRAFFLAILLPLLIKALKRTFYRQTETHSETEPLLRKEERKPEHSPRFDLSLARVSMCIEMAGYIGLPFATTGTMYTVFMVVSSFGGGFGPAVQSTAMELYARKRGLQGTPAHGEGTGRLFGAMSVLQALCASILSPAIYGLVYMKTVATFPKAIFFVSIASLLLALLCVCCVRLPPDDSPDRDIEHHPARDGTLVDVDTSPKNVPDLVVTAPN